MDVDWVIPGPDDEDEEEDSCLVREPEAPTNFSTSMADLLLSDDEPADDDDEGDEEWRFP